MGEAVRYRATTLYDEEAYNALSYLMVNRLRKWPRLIILATGILSVIGAAAMMIIGGRVTVALVTILLLGNLMSMFGLFARQFAAKMMIASSKKGFVPKNTYLFSDDDIAVHSEGKKRSFNYSAVRRVIDMSGFLFFFLQDGQVYMMKKVHVQPDLTAFLDFLNEKISLSRTGKG